MYRFLCGVKYPRAAGARGRWPRPNRRFLGAGDPASRGPGFIVGYAGRLVRGEGCPSGLPGGEEEEDGVVGATDPGILPGAHRSSISRWSEPGRE